MNTNNTPTNELLPSGPDHLEKFWSDTQELNAAKKKGDAVEVARIETRIQTRFGMLPLDKQQDIARFIRQQMASELIQDEGGTTNRYIRRALNVPHIAIKTIADTLPSFTRESIRLLAETLGMAFLGLVEGIRNIRRAA